MSQLKTLFYTDFVFLNHPYKSHVITHSHDYIISYHFHTFATSHTIIGAT